ncbi:MAG: hypothetical protein AABZ55_07540, partial [Bdellovibrionota bacterium]
AQFGNQETRVVFSKNSCFKNDAKAESFIVGRQTVVSASSIEPTRKIEKSLLIYGRNAERDRDFIRTIGPRGAISDFNLTSLDEKIGLYKYKLEPSQKQPRELFLTEIVDRSKDRKVQTALTDPSGNTVARGFRKALKAGEVSYFAGTNWVFTAKGDLIEKNDSLLIRNSDPKLGKIEQKETVFDRENKKIEPREANSASMVVRESVGTLENVKHSKRVFLDGSAMESTDVETDGALYSEQRLMSGSGQLLKTFVRTAAKIDRNEYDKQLQNVFNNCGQCTIRRQAGMK